MARHKNAYIRYRALDKCFRNVGRKYYIEDLLDACNEALREIDSDTDGIQVRQCRSDISFMENELQAPIERIKDGRKKFYRYSDMNFSIDKQLLSETELNRLKEAISIFEQFSGLPQFDWVYELAPKVSQSLEPNSKQIITFEQNEFLSGKEFITPLFDAINFEKCLKIIYKPFDETKPNSFIISPYHLKQYNNRWFLFASDINDDKILNFALDRIQSLEQTNHDYLPKNIDWIEYFEDVVGVTILENQKLTKIKIKVSDQLLPYINTKPIHGSQILLNDILTIEVIPNYELYSKLLSYGSGLTVLEPEEIVFNMKEKLSKSLNNYSINI